LPIASAGGLQHHAVAELQHIGADPLLDLTDCGDIVVDPFLGSRSTLIAPDKTCRLRRTTPSRAKSGKTDRY
jgi:hypothetical protein